MTQLSSGSATHEHEKAPNDSCEL